MRTLEAPDVKERLRALFGIDPRALAFFRILLALLILWDLVDRALDLEAHYTDAGVLPRAALAHVWNIPWYYAPSLHSLGGSLWFEAGFFIAAGLCGLALLLGYRTRAASVLSWILLMSLQNRNLAVGSGADMILRFMTFWSMFLPLGACFSLDATREAGAYAKHQNHFSVASLALLVQVALVYFVTGYLKLKEPAWQDGTALVKILSLQHSTTEFGSMLLAYPGLLHHLTRATLLLELIGPWLMFSPLATGSIRMVLVSLFWAFHLAMAFCMRLDLFPWVSMVSWIPFLPPGFWDRIALLRRQRAPAGEVSLLSDQKRTRSAVSFCGVFLLPMLFLVLVLVWNLERTTKLRIGNQATRAVTYFFGLDQSWGMYVVTDIADGGYFMEGLLNDGHRINLLEDASFFGRVVPRPGTSVFQNTRWSKYVSSLWDSPELRPYYSSYLCQQWNHSHPTQKLVRFEIIYRAGPQEESLGIDPCEDRPR